LDALKIVYDGERMRLGIGESSKISFASGKSACAIWGVLVVDHNVSVTAPGTPTGAVRAVSTVLSSKEIKDPYY
jgi:hypothetical protein